MSKKQSGPMPKLITVYELSDKTCHWPYGDADFRFCGHPAMERSPYCPHHTLASYTPQALARRYPGRYQWR